MPLIQGHAKSADAGGFYSTTIDGSLRFNDDDSAYLSRTPSSAGNRKTWTWSGWYKYSNTSTNCTFSDVTDGTTSNEASIRFDLSKKVRFTDTQGGVTKAILVSNQVCRDPSAWYHVVLKVDTTQATASDRIKIWVNGEQITSWDTETYYDQNQDTMFSSSNIHSLGIRKASSNRIYDGYMAEVNFIDGTALDATSFGEFKSGVWIPKAYEGSYGTNGFYLDFGNSGSIGADVSGNGNNFTANNLAATDVVLDSPTNNFATFNAIWKHSEATFAEGNLKSYGGSTQNTAAFSTIGITSGKYYAEYCITSAASGDPIEIGIVNTLASVVIRPGTDANGWGYIYDYLGNGKYGTNNSYTSATAYGTGDIVGVAFDADAGSVTFYRNNTLIGTLSSMTADDAYYFCGTCHQLSNIHANFGQDSSFAGNKTAQGNTDDNGYGDFYYAPPTGYLALCTANLTVPDAMNPALDASPQDYFNTVLWSGDGTTTGVYINGVGFQPDLVWATGRNVATYPILTDVLRGNQKFLFSNATDAEFTSAKRIEDFQADGFNAEDDYYISGRTYVAWNWKANGSGVSNTDGSITSTVSANTDAGFSIVSYTGNGTTGSTIGHGLGVAPAVIITKDRSNASRWAVYHHANTADPETDHLRLNETTATIDAATYWNDTAPTSTVFTVGTDASVNYNGDNHIAYCWAEVEGFSKIGSYTGNASSDGPFIYTGFRPAFVMIKNASLAGSDWQIRDNARDPYNNCDARLRPNLSNAEDTNSGCDFLSNGFKVTSPFGDWNGSGNTIIYMAFAEMPTKFCASMAR